MWRKLLRQDVQRPPRKPAASFEKELAARGGSLAIREWLRGKDLNLRPSGYEPDELPDCSTPRQEGGEDTRSRLAAQSMKRETSASAILDNHQAAKATYETR